MKFGGKLSGAYFEFLETGEKFREYNLEEGRLHGLQKGFSLGRLHFIETYSQGDRDGKAVYYNPKCGYIVEEGEYRKNMKHGLWYTYQKQKLIIVELYRNDSLVETIYQSPDFVKPNYSIENATPPSDDDC